MLKAALYGYTIIIYSGLFLAGKVAKNGFKDIKRKSGCLRRKW